MFIQNVAPSRLDGIIAQMATVPTVGGGYILGQRSLALIVICIYIQCVRAI
jgi:hypothetical protein